ncbi:response regulator [Pseudalkalibacillus decolorationis]|uniref:response regulator n=1 Tax=Pseudalkalibacillus decolorationis TaxID=163879 RepID=UPI002147A429|nr:response regulator [Pseudalkalibacillus decolorationis]
MIKIVIVEDDFRVAAIHEKFLSKVDDVELVGKALTGKEALSILDRGNVDLLLLDIYMPDQLGTELLQKVRREHPEVDVIMITAVTERELVEISLRYGVIDYIIKPVTLERFVETINEYKERVKVFNTHEEMNQVLIDQFFYTKKQTEGHNELLPKGIDPLTLQKVKGIMLNYLGGISAEDMGIEMGASRTTARRYLEYMTSIGEGSAELEYGIVGRPERKYRIKETSC